MRWKILKQPRLNAPLPTWMIFPAIFAALGLSHLTLLKLPYYWDEADRCCLKVNRSEGPNILLYKPAIKYMYKEN